MSEPIQTPPGTEEVPTVTPTPEQPANPPTPPIDYEKKFSDSTRENQILAARIVELEKSGQDLTKEPTDSELRAAFPEWDTLSDFEKRTGRNSYNALRIAASANQNVRALQDERAWNTGIELAVSSDPALQGKEHAFRQFASKPQYKNVPMDVLIPAFLQKNGGTPPASAPTPKPGLESGNGGPREPEKPKTLSGAELKALRESDPKAYAEYVKTHDIQFEE